jgi:hypothetical protein
MNLPTAVFCAVDKHFTRCVFRARYVVWHPSAQLSGVACELEHQGYGCVHVAVQYCILVHWHGRLLLVHSKVWRILYSYTAPLWEPFSTVCSILKLIVELVIEVELEYSCLFPLQVNK